MFASGTFINSFPKTEKESQCIMNAIKAFKTNIVIVVEDRLLEQNLQKKLKEDTSFMRDNNTIIVFMSKPQDVASNPPS